MPDRDAARGRAQGYVDAAQRFAFPAAEQIATVPQKPDRTLLLYCPKQGGWQAGEWHQGEWTDTLTRGKSLKPTHWMEAPPPARPAMKRNPRRAYDSEGREIEPMSLANMRQHGSRLIMWVMPFGGGTGLVESPATAPGFIVSGHSRTRPEV